jgi:hypothetical protein
LDTTAQLIEAGQAFYNTSPFTLNAILCAARESLREPLKLAAVSTA